jgi:preprotein translocase subunit SecD
MNQFPTWKYVLIALVLAFAALYASPNLYGEDPAVQISHSKGFRIPPEIESGVTAALAAEQITPIEVEAEPFKLLYRFANSEDQLKARDVLQDQLAGQYSVALNLAPATPGFLRALSADPMVLGLDLQGGIHFLMQVDMKAAMEQEIERYVDDVRTILRPNRVEDRIRYTAIRGEKDGVLVQLRSAEDRALAMNRLQGEPSMSGVDLREIDGTDSFNIRLTIQENTLIALQQTALQQNIITLRNRVNELGVAEPIVHQQGGDRIVIQLPGIQDSAVAKEILGKTATLEYRAVDEQNNPLDAANTGRIPPNSRLYTTRDGQPILLEKRLIVSGDQLVGAAAGFDQQSGTPMVSVTLDGVGAKRMLDFTRDNVGNRMAVVFLENKPGGVRSEEVISVAVIREPFGKRFQTTGLGSSEESSQLALLLRAGALAAPVEIIEERTVGPSLGQDNIDKGFKSVIIGFVLVLVLMAIYYRVFGLFANVALAVNLVMVVALLSMLGATLTLPGIAGIVLTVGMAVDANVLIFERIREELSIGNTPRAAIAAGYDKAFSTIADANITTLIAAIVLFTFGTGPIKGFAVTLSLGIITSMFTAIMLTRGLASLVYGGNRRLKKLSI